MSDSKTDYNIMKLDNETIIPLIVTSSIVIILLFYYILTKLCQLKTYVKSLFCSCYYSKGGYEKLLGEDDDELEMAPTNFVNDPSTVLQDDVNSDVLDYLNDNDDEQENVI